MIKIPRNNVAITPIYDSSYSSGRYGSSIVIPDQAKSRVKQGIVKYIGEDVKDLNMGDYVFFPGYSGTIFRLEDEGDLIILAEEDVSCVYLDTERDRITIDGLFFQASDTEYFPATYEQIFYLISKALQSSQWFQNIKIKDKSSEFERLWRGA